jgi:hypothetical protein
VAEEVAVATLQVMLALAEAADRLFADSLIFLL